MPLPTSLHVRNPCCSPAAARAAVERRMPMGLCAEAAQEIRSWPDYAPTPLLALEGLARQAGVQEVWLKDESGRFGLGSFKALGGAFAVQRLASPGATVACATDGNHGRAVAWGARRRGCRCVVYLHAGVSAGREAALRALGAEIVRVAGNYDESVRAVARAAAQEGWTLIGDTAEDESDPAAKLVMAGYTLLMAEAATQLSGRVPTHIFVQAGVGGLAAAVIVAVSTQWCEAPPWIITVEPDRAACVQRSIEEMTRVAIRGSLDTVMAGLSCGEVSAAAWPLLAAGVSDALVVADAEVAPAMRRMFRGEQGDPSLVCGESGVAGILGLLAVVRGEIPRETLGLDTRSRVLLINTEGATDPEVFAALVPEAATAAARDRRPSMNPR